MYCPRCSQPQAPDETKFCPRCGLALGGLKELASAGGEAVPARPPRGEPRLTPRQKGVRQGAALMLLSLVLIPAYVLLAALFPADDRLVEGAVSDTPFEKISQAVLLTIFAAGLARVLYARLFQRGGETRALDAETEAGGLGASPSGYELPPAQSIPASAFGSWRDDTGGLAAARARAGQTTKSLEEE